MKLEACAECGLRPREPNSQFCSPMCYERALARQQGDTRVRPNGEGWQTIDSAPKDGTVIDLWVVWKDDGEGKRVADAEWGRGYIAFESERGEKEGWIAEAWGIDGSQGAMDTDELVATHWMPLPEPPLV